jgi:hypothetical protein
MSKDIAAKLGDYTELLRAESLDLIDFDALIADLERAKEVLSDLPEKSSLVLRVTEDLKAEVRKMLSAITKVKGETTSASMVTSLLDSPNLSYEDLKLLKKEVTSEFNRCLPNRPWSQEAKSTGDGHLTISEFK